MDESLHDGQKLPVRGGVVGIPTRGRTPGHVSLFVRAQGLLIAGEALRVEEGEPVPPLPAVTLDIARAMAPPRPLLSHPIRQVTRDRGGLHTGDMAVRPRSGPGAPRVRSRPGGRGGGVSSRRRRESAHRLSNACG